MLSLRIDKKRIVAPEGTELKMVKMGIQLAPEEIEEYKNLLLESRPTAGDCPTHNPSPSKYQTNLTEGTEDEPLDSTHC
jgi:hypothetical protein